MVKGQIELSPSHSLRNCGSWLEKQGLQRETAVKETGNKTSKDKIQLLERKHKGRKGKKKGRGKITKAERRESGLAPR